MARVYVVRPAAHLQHTIIYAKGHEFPPQVFDIFEDLFRPIIKRKARVRIQNVVKQVKKYWNEMTYKTKTSRAPNVCSLEQYMNYYYSNHSYAYANLFPSIYQIPSAKPLYESLYNVAKEFNDREDCIMRNPVVFSRFVEMFTDTVINCIEYVFEMKCDLCQYTLKQEFDTPILLYSQLMIIAMLMSYPGVHTHNGFVSEIAMLIYALGKCSHNRLEQYMILGEFYDALFIHNSRLNKYVINKATHTYAYYDDRLVRNKISEIESFMFATMFFGDNMYLMLPRFKSLQAMLKYFAKRITERLKFEEK